MEPFKIIDTKQIQVDLVNLDSPIDSLDDIRDNREYQHGCRLPARSWGEQYKTYQQIQPLRKPNHGTR